MAFDVHASENWKYVLTYTGLFALGQKARTMNTIVLWFKWAKVRSQEIDLISIIRTSVRSGPDLSRHKGKLSTDVQTQA